MSDVNYILLSLLGILLALLCQVFRDLHTLRDEVRRITRGVSSSQFPKFYFSRSEEICRALSLLLRVRHRSEQQRRDVLSDVLSHGSRIAEAAYARSSLIDEIVKLLLEQVGKDIVALAVAVREEGEDSLQLERVEGLPYKRVEQPLLIAFDELLDAEQEHWGYFSRNVRKNFDFSAFGIDLSLVVPLRDVTGVCGIVWLGFRKGSQALSPHRRAFIEGIAKQAAATFHASRQIEKRNRETSSERDFLLGMSHDLRAPGNSALYALHDVLSGECGNLNAEQQGRLKIIESALKDQMELLGDVFDFIRVQRGRVSAEREPVELLHSAERVVHTLSAAAAQAGVQIKLEFPEKLCALVDKRHVQRILWNLLSNAIKYAAGSNVVVRGFVLDRDLSQIELHVEDNGDGVPLNEREQLFSDFGRLSNSTAAAGVGLGLTLVKALAEANSGHAFYRPGSVGGSVFGVVLHANPGVSMRSDTDTTNSDVGSILILVVDDDPAACRSVARMFKEYPARVVPVECISEAYDMALALQPDVIICDYHVGELTARDLFGQLRGMNHFIPGVVLTGSLDPDLAENLATQFGIRVVEKPANFNTIANAVRTALATGDKPGAAPTLFIQ